MALKLKRTVNFVDHEYWVAEKHENLRRKGNKRTEIIMMLYTNEASRDAGQDPVLRERFPYDLEGSEKSGKDVYDHIKLSRKEKEDTPEGEVGEAKEVEKNLFTTAEDIL